MLFLCLCRSHLATRWRVGGGRPAGDGGVEEVTPWTSRYCEPTPPLVVGTCITHCTAQRVVAFHPFSRKARAQAGQQSRLAPRKPGSAPSANFRGAHSTRTHREPKRRAQGHAGSGRGGGRAPRCESRDSEARVSALTFSRESEQTRRLTPAFGTQRPGP